MSLGRRTLALMGTLGTSFGASAGDYERGRPGYPPEAVNWIASHASLIVLDAGAGTGKLTAELVRQGHEVIALDPDEAMLTALSQNLPDVETIVGTAEDIALPEEAVDAVVFGQAWHWVDVDAACTEVARVLRPGGTLGLIWNIRDDRVPWVARLTEVMRGSKAEELLAGDGPRVAAPFETLERARFDWSTPMTAAEIGAMVRSRSYFIAGDDDYRAQVISNLGELLGGLPALAGGGRIDVPYVTHAFRTFRPAGDT